MPVIMERLKRILRRSAQGAGQSPLFDPATDGYEQLIAKLHAYFDLHPLEKKQYRSELEFLDHEVAKLPARDRLLYAVLPYPFTLQYDHTSVQVFRDQEVDLYYVYQDGKKLYYHSGFQTVESVQKSFTYISAEQHPASPHRYLDNEFSIKPGDVVADFGAAEGNFSLMVIEQASKVFIVEAEAIWIKALQKTFEPWKEKVVILDKYISDRPDERSVTLNELFADRLPDFIKMDIEGAEYAVLNSAGALLSRSKGMMAVTTYHRHDDEQAIRTQLEKNGFAVKNSPGHLLFVHDRLEPPYFRKGLIRAVK